MDNSRMTDGEITTDAVGGKDAEEMAGRKAAEESAGGIPAVKRTSGMDESGREMKGKETADGRAAEEMAGGKAAEETVDGETSAEGKTGGETPDREKTGGNRKISEALDWFLHVAVAVIVSLLFVTFVAQRTIVHDISMEPTLKDGDNLLVEKLSPRFGWLKRGDIIVFRFPGEKRQLIKRLVAIEGDRVQVIDGKLYVNGELSLIGLPEEPVTPQGDLPEYTDLTVPEGMVYILGDNRLHSLDSTDFGPIDVSWITGRAIFRFFPFGRFGTID
ncbi:MAG TPA: signal peptidase I [Clostridiales bacterium]|nr:signal peptidase I [Clostridiales bacterium]